MKPLCSARAGRGAGGLAALVLAAFALWPASSWAHAAFQDANPEPGARLEQAPARIDLAFTEPLNQRLTTARLLDVRSGRGVAVHVVVHGGDRLVLRPAARLPTGAFRVEWHTVSTLDGHALEGSFGFGVRANAVGGEQQLEQSPLARDGWLRVILRAAFYVALFFFAGGLLCALLLRSPVGPAGWLLAGDVTPRGRATVGVERVWARTRTAGWLAVAAATGVALAETQDAAGSISWHAVDAYLLSTVPGAARAATVLALALAAVLTRRAWRLSACAVLVALAAVAVGGHANSASPRGLALVTDWLHLVAAAAWAGGIAQIVATWSPTVVRLTAGQRRVVARTVLARFGRLALPAAGLVVVAGAGNALIELGRPAELWTTAYGRVLLVKIAVVGAIVSASYLHAFRLRPRIVAASDAAAGQRWHWRLLASEPLLAVLAVTVAALLAAFPLPPHQLLERAEAESEPATAAPLSAPRADELAVAEEAGPWMAAAWVRPTGGRAAGTVRLLDYNVRPVDATVGVAGAEVARCGTGCVTFRLREPGVRLRITARRGGRVQRAVLPIAWDPRGTARARRILARVVAATDRLRSLRIAERLSGGLGGPPAISRYRVDGRHDFVVATRGGNRGGTVVIGRRSWVRQPDGSWQKQVGARIDTRELMPWWTYRTGVRLLDVRRAHGRRVADVALADLPASVKGPPFWFRLRIDLASMRVVRMRMVAPAHFMDQRYYAFDAPVRVRPPRGHR